MIEKYEADTFIIDGKQHHHSIKIIDGKIKLWLIENHELKLDDILELINSKPSYVVIGTGAYGKLVVPKELQNLIISKNIKLFIGKTPDACKKFNDLEKKGKTAALLYNRSE